MKYLKNRQHTLTNFILEKAFDKAFQLEDNAETTGGGNGPATGVYLHNISKTALAQAF